MSALENQNHAPDRRVVCSSVSERTIFFVTLITLVFLVGGPVLTVFLYAFEYGGRFSLGAIKQAVLDPVNQRALFNSLYVASFATIIATILGTALGWVISRTDVPYRGLLRSLLMTPFLIPPFVGSIAWLQLFGPVGWVNKLYMAATGSQLPLFSVYGANGIIILMAVHSYPLVLLFTATAFEKMDGSQEEASLTCGASQFSTIRRITLPLMLPSILGAALIVFAREMAAFGVPSLLGLREGFYVLTTRIYEVKLSFENPNNLNIAAALAVELVVVAALALAAQKWLAGRRSRVVVSGKPSKPATMRMGRWRWFLFTACVSVFLITTVAPLAAILVHSMVPAPGVPPRLSNLTLNNYLRLLSHNASVREGLQNSIFLSFAAASVATVVGFVVAWFNVRSKLLGRQTLDYIGSLPYAIPGTVIGLAFVLFFGAPLFFGIIDIYNTIWIIMFAYIANYLMFAIRASTASLQQIDVSLEEAALICGSNRIEVVRDIVIPSVFPGILAGWFLILMPTLRELNISILLYAQGTMTVGVAVYSLSEVGETTVACAAGVILVALVFGGQVLVERLVKVVQSARQPQRGGYSS